MTGPGLHHGDDRGRQHVAGSEAEPAKPGHLHDRMPASLKREDWADWLGSEADSKDHRAPDDAGLLCRPYPELMVVERTGESWVRR